MPPFVDLKSPPWVQRNSTPDWLGWWKIALTRPLTLAPEARGRDGRAHGPRRAAVGRAHHDGAAVPAGDRRVERQARAAGGRVIDDLATAPAGGARSAPSRPASSACPCRSRDRCRWGGCSRCRCNSSSLTPYQRFGSSGSISTPCMPKPRRPSSGLLRQVMPSSSDIQMPPDVLTADDQRRVGGRSVQPVPHLPLVATLQAQRCLEIGAERHDAPPGGRRLGRQQRRVERAPVLGIGRPGPVGRDPVAHPDMGQARAVRPQVHALARRAVVPPPVAAEGDGRVVVRLERRPPSRSSRRRPRATAPRPPRAPATARRRRCGCPARGSPPRAPSPRRWGSAGSPALRRLDRDHEGARGRAAGVRRRDGHELGERRVGRDRTPGRRRRSSRRRRRRSSSGSRRRSPPRHRRSAGRCPRRRSPRRARRGRRGARR